MSERKQDSGKQPASKSTCAKSAGETKAKPSKGNGKSESAGGTNIRIPLERVDTISGRGDDRVDLQAVVNCRLLRLEIEQDEMAVKAVVSDGRDERVISLRKRNRDGSECLWRHNLKIVRSVGWSNEKIVSILADAAALFDGFE